MTTLLWKFESEPSGRPGSNCMSILHLFHGSMIVPYNFKDMTNMSMILLIMNLNWTNF